jgi:ethanolamine utilization microcompartment shell protein EutL
MTAAAGSAVTPATTAGAVVAVVANGPDVVVVANGPDVVVVANGVARGVTEVEATDADEVPMLLVAVTVKVYAVPLVSPVTLADVAADVAVAVWPPGLAVTV